MFGPKTRNNNGFTIIEILIVLAIGGLIMLIILLAVPNLRRNHRNFNRKQFAEFVAAQMEAFRTDTSKYPGDGIIGSGDQRCKFIQNYLQSTTAICTTIAHAGGSCTTVDGTLYSICFNDNGGSHEYIGEPDEISIILGHVCNDNNLSPEIVVSAGPAHNNANQYAVRTALEDGPVLCIDNQ